MIWKLQLTFIYTDNVTLDFSCCYAFSHRLARKKHIYEQTIIIYDCENNLSHTFVRSLGGCVCVCVCVLLLASVSSSSYVRLHISERYIRSHHTCM